MKYIALLLLLFLVSCGSVNTIYVHCSDKYNKEQLDSCITAQAGKHATVIRAKKMEAGMYEVEVRE